MDVLDEQLIYQVSDAEIIKELQQRLVNMRRSCCFSQKRLSELSGVSVATIKRLETHSSKDLAMTVVIRLLRTMTMLEGVSFLIPEVPESPFLRKGSGNNKQRISSKMNKL